MALTIYLVRHGQSVWNVERRVQGQALDAPGLTEVGRAQAADAAAALAAVGAVDRVMTSDLRRAQETADPIARALGLTPVVDPRLREQAMGTLEGMLSGAAFEWMRDESWSDDSRLGGETGESANEITARLSKLLDKLLTGESLTSVVLVTHGGAIRRLTKLLVATAPDRVFERDRDVSANGSITAAVVSDGALLTLTQVQSIES